MAGIGQRIRSFAFWQLDKLKGGRVKSHYDDVKSMNEGYSDKKVIEQRDKYLKDILSHATHTTDFYKAYTNKNLTEFPVINKLIVKENDQQFVSTNLTYKGAKKVVTSGSTGTPFSLTHDASKGFRNTADTIYFGHLAGFEFGQRLYYCKIWNRFNRKKKLIQKGQNIVPIDVTRLDDETLPQIIDRLKNDRGEKALLGYSSFYDAIGFYMQKNHFSPLSGNNVTAVIAMSEAFGHESRKLISYYLNTPAVSRYSNIENGIIAQQLTDGSDEFLINHASYLVEILELNSNSPVAPGMAGRIVVTDLFNYCMPLIRYDTGDVGVMGEKLVMGHHRPVLTCIEGRKMDLIYDAKGSLLSSYIITNNMWKYKEVKQYQFIQISQTDYHFLLNIDGEFDRENELIDEFKGYLGHNANVTVDYIHEIPVLASGKRKKVVNNFVKYS